MTSSIANHGETLAPLMRPAGFRYVFLGIENVLEEDLAFLQRVGQERAARGRPPHRQRDAARDRAAAPRTACTSSAASSSAIPDDTRESIETNLAFARRYVDWPYIQHPTPYPGTPMTKDFRERGLIVNERVGGVRRHDRGRADASISTADEIEFMRWRAERWMKVRHLPAALRHYPRFVLRHGRRCCAHTFRGSTWRSALGLEDSRAVFARYKAIRRAEREYLGPPVSGLESRVVSGPGSPVSNAV